MKSVNFDRTDWAAGWIQFRVNGDGSLSSTDFCVITNADGDQIPKQSSGFPAGWTPAQSLLAYAQKRTLDLVGGTIATRVGTQFIAS